MGTEAQHIDEVLKERREGESISKALNWVPFNVYSFSELETAEQLDDVQKSYSKVFNQFMQIADNIMYDRPDGYPNSLINLVKEFHNKLIDIKLQAGMILKSGSIALFKANNQLQWIGVPTNKFQDREKDILSDAAHKEFVALVKSGNTPYPELRPWHSAKIGETTWIDYDERGFLVAGGHILKEFENYAINLITNTNEPLGMSHGMYSKDIVRDIEGTIVSYKSFEFSFLPQSNAANLLTSFTLGD